MAIESTGRLRAWRPFPEAIAVVVAGLALMAAGSGSSSAAGAPADRTGPTGPRAHVVTLPSAIDATGQRDVQPQLQAFIASVPTGTTIQFHKNGRYRLERALYLRNKRELTLDGNGATIFATQRGARDRSQIRVERGRRLVFRDLIVKGVNPDGGVGENANVEKLETQHGFRFDGVYGAELDHVRVTDVYGDFVSIGRDEHDYASRGVWVHDSTFARGGRQGISVTDANDVIIEHNHFSDMPRSTIDLEPDDASGSVSNAFVLDNTIGRGGDLFIAAHGQGPVDDVVISGNVLQGHDLTLDVLPPERQRRSNWVITGNVSDTVARQRPMRFFAIDGLVVQNNTQPVTGGDPGVVLTDDCGTVVSGNRFGGAGVTRHGAPCAAPLVVPAVPAIPGRIGRQPRPPATNPHPTTTPHRGGTNRPPSTRPRPRPSAPEHSNGSRLVLGVGALALAGGAIAWLVRRRRGLR